MALFDPFYYVSDTQNNQVNDAYQYFSKVPTCNNIVGDYKDTHSYYSNVNAQVQSAIAACFAEILA